MTKSLEDYIEAIQVLIRDKGAARVRDVAAALGVKMPSVVKAIGELKKLGLATQEPYGNIELTEKGARVAAFVLGRHTVLKAFLLKLGVGDRSAEKDACLMEHILSAETMERIQDFLGQNEKTAAKPVGKKGERK
ncbi:MAG: metal-dependent transcriptional regulator [Kiritimatiellia bacterium]